MLVERLVSRGHRYEAYEKFFETFYGRYQDLIVKYQKSVSDIVRDSFPSDTEFTWIVTSAFFNLDL